MRTGSEHPRVTESNILRDQQALLALSSAPDVGIGMATEFFVMNVLDVVTKGLELPSELDRHVLIELNQHQMAGSSGTGRSSSADAAAKAITVHTSSRRSAGKL